MAVRPPRSALVCFRSLASDSRASLSAAQRADSARTAVLRRTLPLAPDSIGFDDVSARRALFDNAPPSTLLASADTPGSANFAERVASFDPFAMYLDWYAREPSFIYWFTALYFSREQARDLYFAVACAQQSGADAAPTAQLLAHRALMYLALAQKSRNARCVPFVLLLHGIVDVLYGHLSTPVLHMHSALRVSLSRAYLSSFLVAHGESVAFPFGTAYYSTVDNFDFSLNSWIEKGGARNVHRSILLEICLPLPPLLWLELIDDVARAGGTWLERSVPTDRVQRLTLLLSVLTLSTIAQFTFAYTTAQSIVNVIRAHATLTADAARARSARLGHHLASVRFDAARPFLRPPYMEWQSSKRPHVAALLHTLVSQHVSGDASHRLHFVVCDAQIYLQAWNRIDEDIASSERTLSVLFPIPGLWHLADNLKDCIHKLAWDVLLGPAAHVLGWKRATRDGHDFDACERLLEAVGYAITRFFVEQFGDEDIRSVTECLVEHDRPTHLVLFIFIQLLAPFFELRAMIRARDFRNVCTLLKFILPTFVACQHRNYASVVARFLLSLDLALPSVRAVALETLANALTPGAHKGQAGDLILERVRVRWCNCSDSLHSVPTVVLAAAFFVVFLFFVFFVFCLIFTKKKHKQISARTRTPLATVLTLPLPHLRRRTAN
jgi:hypothetical protein